MSSYLWHINDLENLLRSFYNAASRGAPDDYTRGRLDALRDIATAVGATLDKPVAATWVVRDDGQHVTAALELPSLVMED
jgi:hypothetical protein